jgi:predicted transcriptional regulator
MAISNELSSEIAAAILANESSPQNLQKLKAVILEVHSALQKMSEEEHLSRLRAIAAAASPTDRGSH